MASAPLSHFLRRLSRGMVAEVFRDQRDRDLIDRFLFRQEEAVFEALMQRHGPMVYRVCWRVLQHSQDAEDAFQATFLVLAKKLHSVRNRDSLASWLHGVAYRVARKAKVRAAVRRQHEQQAMRSATFSPHELLWREVRTVLDAELAALPDIWRLPLVLCYLEGRTQDEAARHLGWSKSTLVRRLGNARAALGRRLKRRGLVWPAVLSAVLLSDCIRSAALPAGLLDSTARAATCVALGETGTGGLISAQAAVLTKGVLQAMLLTHLKIAMIALFSVGVLAAGVAALTASALESGQEVAYFAPANEHSDSKPTAKGKDEAQLRATIKAHTATVMCATFSPDGKMVATGGGDDTVQVLDVGTGKLLATLKGHTDPIRSVLFFPDGKLLASASEDHTIRFWDLPTFQFENRLQANRPVYNLAISPDGKKLAIATGDWTRKEGIHQPGQVCIWDVATGTEEMMLPGHDPTVWSVAFRPDGKWVASVQQRENVQLWDLTTGKEIGVLKHPAQIRPLAFSPDGKSLVTGLQSGVVRMWNIAGQKPTHENVQAHEAQIFSVQFSPNGKYLATASEDETVKLWKVSGGRLADAGTLKGHEGQVWFAAFSPDGKTLVTGGKDQTVRIWDVSRVCAK